MSRIIIKNLPERADEKILKQQFEKFGGITDCKVMRTPQGNSRKFGFIGFENEDQAQTAITKMNGAYIQSSKLQVSLAKAIGDQTIERPWSKYSVGSSSFSNDKKRKVIPTKHETQTIKKKKDSSSLDELKKMANERRPKLDNGKKKKFDSEEDDQNNQHMEEEEIINEQEHQKSMDEIDVKDWEEGRIYITNLPFNCTEDDIRKEFDRFGNIAEIHLPIDKITKKSKGFGFVLFVVPQDAVKACNEMDNKFIKGRIVHVTYAKADPYSNQQVGESKNYKEKKQNELKAKAGNQFNWSTLYMRQDTAVSAVAEELGMKKEEILDVNAESMAVRVALAENYVINQTKKWLEENGVNCTVLENGMKEKRSNNIIIVKNIAASAIDLEVKSLFEKFGTLKQFLMPKSKALALVEFEVANDAKTAFKRLVYSRYRGIPLYLEWAPEKVFDEEKVNKKMEEEKLTQEKQSKTIQKEESQKKKEEKTKQEEDKKKQEEDKKKQEEDKTTTKSNQTELVEEGSKTLYVKNISFKTKEDVIRKVFEKCGRVLAVTLSKTKDKKVEKNSGFGFVEYAKHEDAINAIKTLQGKVIDGHAVQIEISQPKVKDEDHKERKEIEEHKVSNKLLVKNVPFETNIKEVRELFRTYGTLRGVRLPKKVDGQNKGFAFVEYATKQEAANAMAALKNSHFYGRHLIIEYAKDTELD
ncbi:RNA recognition motif domain containing protein [Entamoeba nuttalli P19]|uniref:RNA recognition motif domain containing protein n=1 Tax=Entamoeba nuttalli (strain P19) TaxID=1076696 RepID=K2GZY9_ENTNP|nr:RNA recognition motif domain containing protein [Entamoeba nuttalli P19]EKE39532.1 RNA recognition motif domain containing protein [Entamoeba nuttalli P19]|eukprot:XP_008858149.1 RNA recognition motif domain containing protein [Entamoeba nuttalli P19]